MNLPRESPLGDFPITESTLREDPHSDSPQRTSPQKVFNKEVATFQVVPLGVPWPRAPFAQFKVQIQKEVLRLMARIMVPAFARFF